MATSFDPLIRRVAIEAFRGFRDRQEFDLGASVIILAGPNGTGKTSLFDALQWCLLGTIQRLEDLRSRRNVEHVVNQYRLAKRATVEIDMLVDGRALTIRRTGDHSGSTLEFREDGANPLFGPDAEKALEGAIVPGEGLTLDMALTTSGLMQQDVMRAVLEAKPADRYRHITTVLGLGVLEDFEDALRDVAREAKDQADAAQRDRDAAAASLQQARDRLIAAEQRVQALPRVDALRADVAAQLGRAPSGVIIAPSLPSADSSGIRELSAEVADLMGALESFSAAWESAREASAHLAPAPTGKSIQAAKAALKTSWVRLDSLRATAADAQSRLEAAQAASENLAKLAALAIPMLTEQCPLCGQKIDAAHVEHELRARAAETETMLSFQTAAHDARRQLREAELAETKAKLAVNEVEALRARWSSYRTMAGRASQVAANIASRTGQLRVVTADADELAQRVFEILSFLRALRSRLYEVLDPLEQGIDRGQFDRAKSEVASLTEVLMERSERLEQARRRARELKTLADASVGARVEVTESRMRAVQPLVSDIFSRLDPHPAFKTIEFELDTYYRRGTTSPLVRDLVEEVSADPLVVFSTSQANIAALSYFLAMGWSARGRTLPFVLLDDPVQSMDDVNVLGFADLCRYLRTDRQLIISTHERRFARLLERKLAPRAGGYTTRVIEFVGWDRSGPAVETRTVESQLVDDPIRIVQGAS